MRSNRALLTLALSGLGLVASGCSHTTSGGGGLAVMGPATLTHGVCAVLTIDYIVEADGGSVPGPAPSDRAYHVTAVNGAVFADSGCTTPLSGDAVIHAGSTSVDVGFVPAAAGMTSGITVVDASNALVTAGYEVLAD